MFIYYNSVQERGLGMSLSKQEIKCIKHSKIQEIFINTAQEMIINEGTANVTTRQIAQRSGFSIGTLYNYFENVDELMWIVRNKMIDESVERIKKALEKIESIDEVSNICINLFTYIIENPNIYNFIYKPELNPDYMHQRTNNVYIDVDEFFVHCNLKSDISSEDIKTICHAINFMIYGMINIYFLNSNNMDKESYCALIPKIINKLFAEVKSE